VKPRLASLSGSDALALPDGVPAEGGLPADLAEEERRLAARRLRFFVALAWGVVPAFALPVAFSPETRPRALMVVGWGLAVLLTPVLLGRRGEAAGEETSQAPDPVRLQLAVHWFVACCWASLTAETFLLGGIDSSSTYYLPLLPCLAVLLAGAGAALPWAGLCGATTLLACALDYLGRLPPQELDRGASVLHAGGTMLFGVGLAAGLGFLFARQKELALRRLAVERGHFAWHALHDALTGLPNRALVQDRLEAALERSRRGGRRVAVIFLDLDGLKAVNDARGHAAGDGLLREAARRVGSAVRGSDTLGRMGGDEFVVVADDLADRKEAELVMRRLEWALAGGRRARRSGRGPIRASFGLALHPDDGDTAEKLLAAADAAMYRAKTAPPPADAPGAKPQREPDGSPPRP